MCMYFTFTLMFAHKGPPLPKQNDSGQPGLPIDGGISLLFISGVVFGVYSLTKKK